MITGKLYDRLKWLAQIGLPAVGALYFGIAQIWGLPAAEEVVGTVVVVDTFLGALLGISQSQFNSLTPARQERLRNEDGLTTVEVLLIAILVVVLLLLFGVSFA